MTNARGNSERRIQRKKDEISKCMENIQTLKNELTILENELDDLEFRHELKEALGYARIGQNNI